MGIVAELLLVFLREDIVVAGQIRSSGIEIERVVVPSIRRKRFHKILTQPSRHVRVRGWESSVVPAGAIHHIHVRCVCFAKRRSKHLRD